MRGVQVHQPPGRLAACVLLQRVKFSQWCLYARRPVVETRRIQIDLPLLAYCCRGELHQQLGGCARAAERAVLVREQVFSFKNMYKTYYTNASGA